MEDTNQDLINAIKSKNEVSFEYDGRQRISRSRGKLWWDWISMVGADRFELSTR